ncbi:MAG: hypothetical protein MR483_01420 [Bacteroidales bacterium]|nr:hypothetical protein [Bacteroidales bacterium]
MKKSGADGPMRGVALPGRNIAGIRQKYAGQSRPPAPDTENEMNQLVGSSLLYRQKRAKKSLKQKILPSAPPACRGSAGGGIIGKQSPQNGAISE